MLRRARGETARLATLPVVAAIVAATWVAMPAAKADTAPVAPVPTATVSADALPTVQVNGLVRSQVIVGDRVYVTGEFTSARPAGSPAGTNEVPRGNVLAYTLSTGELISSWAPSLNAQGKSIVASADGSRIFVGGSFTAVNGVNKYRVVALDAQTGQIITSFTAGTNTRVNALAVSGNTLYMGGIFTTVGTDSRSGLAAVDATTGAVLAWNPNANDEVMALVAPAGSGKVVAGGKFTQIGGQDNYGMGAIDATTGALLPWAIKSTVKNAGDNAAIFSLATDGGQVYGSGYTYGSGGNFEGTFAARSSDGAIVFVTGCRGDTYSTAPIGGVLYYVGHAHDCSAISGQPQENPWTFQRASAETTGRAASGLVNTSGNFTGQPAPEYLTWNPSLGVGDYTGSSQAAWSVTGNGDYVVLGGEFVSVNGTAQQGLVRLPARAISPNAMGPQGGADLTPTVATATPGGVRLSWKTAWDMDNRRLTYQVLRNNAVIGTLTRDSEWYARPTMSFTDITAPAGISASYRVRVVDPLGNSVTGAATAFTTPATTSPSSPYTTAVRADGATSHWRLDESSGSVGYDWSGGNSLTIGNGATRNVAGALSNESDPATRFGGFGSGSAPAYTSNPLISPQVFSEEAWINTTTTSGGKIIGFGNNSSSSSTTYDRHVYMTNNGQLIFGVLSGGVRQVITSPNRYNNGVWHHVVSSFGADGMKLYVDGGLVASRADVTVAQGYRGYWRIAGDNLGSAFGGWPSRPGNSTIVGAIDDVAVYPTVLSAAAVQRHYDARQGAAPNQAPTASFSAAVTGGTVAVDATTSADVDGTIASYAWNFGDGTTATGVTASRTYAAAGTFTVTLTVTDDKGATGTSSQTVTAAPPVAGQPVATDDFGRTVTGGFGTADLGGVWTTSASGSTLSVADGSALSSIPASRTTYSYLRGASNQDTDLSQQFWTDNAITGGGIYVSSVVRSTAAGEYRTRIKVTATGGVQANLTKVVGGTETNLTSPANIAGLTYTTGDKLVVRTQASGVNPTTLRYRIWKQGDVEPTTWAQTVTDATAGLQEAGSVGIIGYASGSVTAPVLLRYDALSAVRL